MLMSRAHSQTALNSLIPIVAALFMGGCSSSPNNHPEPSSSSTQKSVLRVWQTETDSRAKDVLQNMERAFEAKYPQVDLQIESVGWSSLADKISSAVRNDSPPDLAHLEPFMVYELVKDNLLLPITDVVADLEKQNGPIYSGVRDLQKYADNYYGIAYAVGTTAYAYRKDIQQKLGLSVPKTWKEYVAFVRAMHQESGGKLPALLPGGDPFFIDQLFAELVANNGGKLFDVSKRPPEPLMESQPVVETLQFFQDIAPYVDSGWRTQPYLDQFDKLATGKAGNVLVTYARAFRAIEANQKNLPPGVSPTPDYFALMPQPSGPSFGKGGGRAPIATIDCEPFVIFRKAEGRRSSQNNLSNADLAKIFLKDFFYNRTYYLDFVKSVPIHLTPIFPALAQSPDYQQAPPIRNWAQWAKLTDEVLAASDRTRPILMPDTSEGGRQLPFLMELQARRLLTNAVVAVVADRQNPKQVAATLQESVRRLVRAHYQ